MAILCVRSCLLEGGERVWLSHLLPNFDNLFNNPSASFPEIVYAAMSQAVVYAIPLVLDQCLFLVAT